MMPLTDQLLQAYLDDALPADQRAAVAARLAQSPADAARLASLRCTQTVVQTGLQAIDPPPAEKPSTAAAWHQVQHHLTAQPQSPAAIFSERMNRMFNNDFLKRYQTPITIVALLAVIAVAFTFAPVRAVAGDFLQIFRVQEVKVIPVDVSRLEAMEENEEFVSLMEQFSADMEGGHTAAPEAQTFNDLAAAQPAVDYPITSIGNLPADAPTDFKVMVQPQHTSRLNLDRDLLEAIFAAADIEISLPDSLNNSPIVVHKPTSVVQMWGADDDPTGVSLMQMPTPEIEYPDDLDLNALGVAGLQLMGMSAEEAQALGATIDWANTLVLPIPANGDIDFEPVTVNGADGFLFSSPTEAGAALMWQADGQTFFLNGAYDAAQMLSIAQSVR